MEQVKQAFIEAKTAFLSVWPEPLGSRLARMLLAHLLQMSPASVEAHLTDTLPASIARRLPSLLKRIQNAEPLAYLIGYAPFLERSFIVTRSTLIPRPETEELVFHVLRRWDAVMKRVLAIDLGTGSGCIAVSLAAARTPGSIVATDTSKRALLIAQQNAKRILGALESRMCFLQTSLFSRTLQQLIIQRQPTHLFIVANLPYLPQDEEKELPRSVTAFEPKRALYANDKGNALILQSLRQIARFLKRAPSLSCTAYFEFDPPQASALQQAASAIFPQARIRVLQDQNHRNRFLEIIQP